MSSLILNDDLSFYIEQAKLTFTIDSITNLNIIKRFNNNIQFEIYKINDLKNDLFNKCFELIENGLGDKYERRDGKFWKRSKKIEMKENGLIYIILKNDNENQSQDQKTKTPQSGSESKSKSSPLSQFNNNIINSKDTSKIKIQIIAFLSLMITEENNIPVLYLYEIHIKKGFQGQNLGSTLLDLFHKFSNDLNKKTSIEQKQEREQSTITQPFQSQFQFKYTMLSVFSSNIGALKLYQKKGYKLSDHSQKDRKLRGGRIIKPTTYEMMREIDIEN